MKVFKYILALILCFGIIFAQNGNNNGNSDSVSIDSVESPESIDSVESPESVESNESDDLGIYPTSTSSTSTSSISNIGHSNDSNDSNDSDDSNQLNESDDDSESDGLDDSNDSLNDSQDDSDDESDSDIVNDSDTLNDSDDSEDSHDSNDLDDSNDDSNDDSVTDSDPNSNSDSILIGSAESLESSSNDDVNCFGELGDKPCICYNYRDCQIIQNNSGMNTQCYWDNTINQCVSTSNANINDDHSDIPQFNSASNIQNGDKFNMYTIIGLVFGIGIIILCLIGCIAIYDYLKEDKQNKNEIAPQAISMDDYDVESLIDAQKQTSTLTKNGNVAYGELDQQDHDEMIDGDDTVNVLIKDDEDA